MRWPQGRIVRGAIVTMVIRLTALGLGFLQTLILARLLGPESYGQVVAVISAATMAAWIGVLGLNGLATREIARFRQRGDAAAERGFLRFSTVAVAGAASLAGIAAYVLAAPALPGFAGWIVALSPTIALVLLFRGASLGSGDVIGSQAPLDALRPAIYLAVMVTAVLAGVLTPAIAVALNTAAFVLTLLAAGVRLTGRTLAAAPRATSLPNLRPLKDALPFFLAGVFATLQAEMMVLMLTALSTPNQTGLFQVAFRLSTLLLVIRQAIDVPLAPRFAALWDCGALDDLERLACLSAAASTVAALSIWLGFFTFAGSLTGVFGAEFVAARDSLVVLAAAQVLFVAAGPLPILLNMADRAGAVTAALGAAQVVQLLLGLLLVPHLGAFGAALAMSAAVVAWTFGMWRAARRRLGVRVSPLRGLTIYARRGLR